MAGKSRSNREKADDQSLKAAKAAKKAKKAAKATKMKIGVTLSPSGSELLARIATQAGVSKSDLVDRIVRGEIAIAGPAPALQVTVGKNALVDTDAIAVVGEGVAPTDPEPAGTANGREPSPPPESDLRAQLAEQARRTRDLEQRLAQHQSRSEEQTRATALSQRETDRLVARIAELEQQLARGTPAPAASDAAEANDLRAQLSAERDRVRLLRAQLAELQPVAAIGQAQLDKWRR